MSGEATSDSFKPGHKLGPYEILEEIGRGGMGIVYKAHESALNRTVALKLLPDQLAANPGFVQRFTREAQSAAALQHPGIVTIYSVGQEDKVRYIAMQYVNGPTLADVLETGGPLEVPRALEFAAEICDALAEAHEYNIIHRDIKPHNIMLDDKNRVKMTDFGLAKAVNDRTLTTAGFILGTPTHMAPEQCNGQPADHRSDLYSVGVVLYEMLTGKPPFTGETPLSLMRQIADMPFPKVRDELPDVPESVVEIIERLTAKDPEARYQRAADAAKDLRNAQAGKPVSAASQQEPTVLVEALPAFQQAKRGARRAMAIGAVLALVFVLVLWGSIRLRRALVDDAAASEPIEWESPEIPAYTSPFDPPDAEPELEPAVAAVDEPASSADARIPANELPPDLQERVRTGSELPTAPDEPVTASSQTDTSPASTEPEPSYTPPVNETQETIRTINDVLKKVDNALGGGPGKSDDGPPKGRGRGNSKK